MNKTLDILKSGGSIVLAGILAFIIWQVVQGDKTTINNHIDHSTEAWIENKEAVLELKNSMWEIKHSIDANTRVLERLENKL